MTAGYSGTPLPRKLGIGAASRVLVLGAPADFTLAAPHHVRAGQPGYDIQLLFCPDAATLRRRWPAAAARSTERGAVWVALRMSGGSTPQRSKAEVRR